MNGAELDEIKKKRYAAINKELSSLYTNFANNVFNDSGEGLFQPTLPLREFRMKKLPYFFPRTRCFHHQTNLK